MPSSAKPGHNPRIAAVVVTFNRVALLQEAIAALRAQSRLPDAIIVINNSSTDGTRQWLETQPDLLVVHQENLGGAGGFHTGIRVAADAGFDWFWLMDDDTIPDPEALARLVDVPEFLLQDTGFLSSEVRWIDGSPHPMNLQLLDPRWALEEGTRAAAAERVTCASFVSILISRAAVVRVGLPLKEFFIWFDDAEYTRRICASMAGYVARGSKVLHKTAHNLTADQLMWRDSANPKAMYGWRNYSYLRKLRAGGRIRTTVVCTGILVKRLMDCALGRLHPRVLLWTMQGFRMQLTPDRLDRTASQAREDARNGSP